MSVVSLAGCQCYAIPILETIIFSPLLVDSIQVARKQCTKDNGDTFQILGRRCARAVLRTIPLQSYFYHSVICSQFAGLSYFLFASCTFRRCKKYRE